MSLWGPVALGAAALSLAFRLQRGLWPGEYHYLGDPDAYRGLGPRRWRRAAGALVVLGLAVALAAWGWPERALAFGLLLGVAAVALACQVVRHAVRVPPWLPSFLGLAALGGGLVLVGPYPWPDRTFGGALVGAAAAATLFVLVIAAYGNIVRRETLWIDFKLAALLMLGIVAAAWFAWWGVGLAVTLLALLSTPAWGLGMAMGAEGISAAERRRAAQKRDEEG